MRFRSTLILTVFAVLAVAAAIVAERVGGSASGAGRDAAVPLVAPGALPGDRVTSITLERDGEPTLAFAFEDGAWQQVEPFAYLMDPHSMQQLAAVAGTLAVVDSLDADGDVPLAALGLDPPRGKVTWSWPGGSFGVYLGRRGIGGVGYIRVAGDDRVSVVGQGLHERVLDMNPKEWRDRRLFHGAGIESDRIEIDRGPLRTVLVRDRRAWQLAVPAPTRVDVSAVTALFDALGRAVSSGFLLDDPDDLAPFGLDRPVASVVVTNEPDDQRLLIGARIGVGSQDRFGMVEGRPVVVRVTEPVLAAILPAPDALAARTASGVEPADVKSIRIATGDTDVLLEREIDRWTAPEHGGAEVDREFVDEILAQITELQASEVVFGAYPRELEVATITMFGFGGRPIDTVRIARETEAQGKRWAFENGDGVLRIFPASVVPRLRPEHYGLSAP